MAGPSSVSRNAILESMGLEPSRSGSTAVAQDARISAALKGCQRLDYFFTSQKPNTIVPSTYSSWNHQNDDARGFHRAFAGASVAESNQNMMSFGATPQSKGPFDDLRQSLMFFGMVVEEQKPDRRCLAIQDPGEKCGFCVRIVDVRTVRDLAVKSPSPPNRNSYPMLVVLYKFDKAEDLSQGGESMRWLSKVTRNMGLTKFRTISAAEDEQHLLLKLLELNSSLLASTYTVPRWPEESGFKLSFILPCLPLNAPLLARHQFPAYCWNACDKDAVSVCGGCGVSRYCSSACQAAHWPLHRKDCKEGDQAPYYAMKLVHANWPHSLKYNVTLNNLDCPIDMEHKSIARTIDANAPLLPDLGQGLKPFLVKLQADLMTAGTPNDGGMLLHNPEKTIACKIKPGQPGYSELLGTMRQHGRDGMRLYIYARRSDKDTIRLYYSSLPDQRSKW